MNLPEKFKDKMKGMLGGAYGDFISAYRSRGEKALHINTIKCGGGLRDFVLPPLFSNCESKQGSGGTPLNCFRADVEGLGRHPYHAAGAYYIQEPSAMLPALSFDLPAAAKVLDMCASPGGKTSQLALRLNYEGLLVSNEYESSRVGVLKENITRMGYTNVAVANMHPEKLAALLPEYFDAVIVDAPCSGEGMFRKNPDAARQWSPGHVFACARRQKEIVRSAAGCVKYGGILVYSTCTFSEEEDEQVVDYIISLGFTLVPVKPEIAACGVDTGKGIKCFPHIFGEGQYFAVLKKSGRNRGHLCQAYEFSNRTAAEVPRLNEIMDISGLKIANSGGALYSALPLPRPLDFGVKLAVIEKDGRLTPAHNLFTAYFSRCRRRTELTREEVSAYLRGEEIIKESEPGWGCAAYQGLPLGGYKSSGGVLKNHYPKPLRHEPYFFTSIL